MYTKCYICKKQIYRSSTRILKRNFCSYRCRNIYYSGKNSFVYKHGFCVHLKKGQRYNKKMNKLENRDRITDAIRKIAYKIKALTLLGGRCHKCGYNKCLASLDFHHKNPKLKTFDGSRFVSKSWTKIFKETKNCIILCANCHREFHFNNGKYKKYVKKAKKYLYKNFKPRKKYKWT